MITFTITIKEDPNSKLIQFTHETSDAPDATESEIKYGKAFKMCCAVFKEKLQGPEHMQKPEPRFHKSYGSGDDSKN